MYKRGNRWMLALGALSFLVSGCTQTELTKPKRSATEQLLISTAADRALAQADLSMVAGKKVFVDRSYFDAEDEDYVVSEIRELITMRGGMLVREFEDADLIVEPRSGALSIDSTSWIIGLPSTPTPVPLVGTVQFPEIAIWKSDKQFSIAKLAMLAYERDSGKHVAATGPLIGRANIKYYKFLGVFSYNKTTVPERQKQTDEQKKQQGH